MEKIIFLDMDGVIATRQTIINGIFGITQKCQNALGRILDETNAKLVISSAWRTRDTESTKTALLKAGFAYSDRIVGVTPMYYDYYDQETLKKRGIKKFLRIPRGVEIATWIDDNVGYEDQKNFSYVILDDDSDMLLKQAPSFIHCKEEVGLTEYDATRAIQILLKK